MSDILPNKTIIQLYLYSIKYFMDNYNFQIIRYYEKTFF